MSKVLIKSMTKWEKMMTREMKVPHQSRSFHLSFWKEVRKWLELPLNIPRDRHAHLFTKMMFTPSFTWSTIKYSIRELLEWSYGSHSRKYLLLKPEAVTSFTDYHFDMTSGKRRLNFRKDSSIKKHALSEAENDQFIYLQEDFITEIDRNHTCLFGNRFLW